MKRAQQEILLSPAERHMRDFQTFYLSPDYKPPIFDTHDIEFALRQGPAYDQIRDYNTALHSFLSMSFNGRRGIYVAGSISKGMLANSLAVKEGPFTLRLSDGTTVAAAHVSDMDETVGAQLFSDIVIQQNRRVQIQTQGLLEPLFGDQPFLIPSMLQAAASLAGLAEFDRGAKRRDSAWMQVWTAIIREHINVFPVLSDWFFSGATSGLEYPEAECIAAGLRLDRRPDADMWFRDLNNRDVPQSELIRRRVEYLVWAAEQGDFRGKHEATALMRSFAIAEMAKRGQLPHANPIFLQGILDNIDAIDTMREVMEPLLLERINTRMFPFDTTDLAAVFPDFVARVEAIKATHKPNLHIHDTPPSPHVNAVRDILAKRGIEIHRYTAAEMDAGDFAFRELATLDPSAYLDRTERNLVTRPNRFLDGREQTYVAQDGRSLFSRSLLSGLNDRERHQVIAAIGGLETLSPRQGRSVYVVSDQRYGPKAEEARKTRGFSHSVNLQRVLGKAFQTIAKTQRQQTTELPILQRFVDRQQAVRFSHDFDDIQKLYGALPHFSMASGDVKSGKEAQLVIRHTLLARDVTDFCFPTGRWEESDQGVQDIILATRMQLGLEAASPIDPHFVRVFNEHGHPLTLADRAAAIFEKLKPALLEAPDAIHLQEQASALVQLRAFHRLARDHSLRHHVFAKLRTEDPHIFLPDDLKWERIPAEIFAYDHRAFDALWDKEIKPVLEKNASQIIRLRHLEPVVDFKSIRDQQLATQEIIAAGPPKTASIYRRTEKRPDA